MTNIPIELLRAFVTVVDLRSFTKAAHALGVTQPAVSAQLKRLQILLGCDLLDRTAPCVLVTPTGEMVIAEARRLLAINDKILETAAIPPSAPTLRVGIPGDLVGALLTRPLASFRKHWPSVHLNVQTGIDADLVEAFQQGGLDVLVVNSSATPVEGALFHWQEEMVWIRAPSMRVEPSEPVPLVSHGAGCLVHQHVVSTLTKAGWTYDLVFTGTNFLSLISAVGLSFGVMGIPRCLFNGGDVGVWADGPLPRLPPLYCNVLLRRDASAAVALPAEAFADSLRLGLERGKSAVSQFPELVAG
jgi:DNA-binding transcriptional LysR family regulator